MTDKTWDAQDPRDLPYRFVYSPITGEVMVVTIGMGLGVAMMFLNYPSFHRFLEDGNKTASLISAKILKDASNILTAKEKEEGEL